MAHTHTDKQKEWLLELLVGAKTSKLQILNGLYLLDLRLVLAARALLEHLAYFSATSCLSAFSFIMVPVEYPAIYLDQNTPNTEIHYYQTMSRWTYADSLSTLSRKTKAEKINMPCAFDISVLKQQTPPTAPCNRYSLGRLKLKLSRISGTEEMIFPA